MNKLSEGKMVCKNSKKESKQNKQIVSEVNNDSQSEPAETIEAATVATTAAEVIETAVENDAKDDIDEENNKNEVHDSSDDVKEIIEEIKEQKEQKEEKTCDETIEKPADETQKKTLDEAIKEAAQEIAQEKAQKQAIEEEKQDIEIVDEQNSENYELINEIKKYYIKYKPYIWAVGTTLVLVLIVTYFLFLSYAPNTDAVIRSEDITTVRKTIYHSRRDFSDKNDDWENLGKPNRDLQLDSFDKRFSEFMAKYLNNDEVNFKTPKN